MRPRLLEVLTLVLFALLCARAASNSQKSSAASIFTLNDIHRYADLCGLQLKVQPTGPYLRLEAYPKSDEESIGYLTAFMRPWPLGMFQLDTIQVQNRRQTLGFARKSTVNLEGPGISFIMGSYALRWAYERGCRVTQLLAVKDTEEMHQVLIRLYSSFGFRVVKELTDSADSIPDRLVWGAEGTLMEMDIEAFLHEWSPKLKKLILVKEQLSADSSE